MKKNNNNNNYFSQNIQKFGEDFLVLKNARQLEFDAIKVFREMSQNKINIDKYGHYFLEQQFLDSLIKAANTKYIYHNISYTAISMVTSQDPRFAQDQNVLIVLDQHKRSFYAYQLILTVLNNVRATYDYSYIYALSDQLRQYRNDL